MNFYSNMVNFRPYVVGLCNCTLFIGVRKTEKNEYMYATDIQLREN